MKTQSYFILIFVFLIVNNSAASPWTEQVSGTTEPLHSSWFTETGNGHAAGDKGTILFTHNGGETWNHAATQGDYNKFDFRGIHFPEAQFGFATAKRNDKDRFALFYSRNYGDTWDTLHLQKGVQDAVYFTSTDEGYFGSVSVPPGNFDIGYIGYMIDSNSNEQWQHYSETEWYQPEEYDKERYVKTFSAPVEHPGSVFAIANSEYETNNGIEVVSFLVENTNFIEKTWKEYFCCSEVMNDLSFPNKDVGFAVGNNGSMYSFHRNEQFSAKQISVPANIDLNAVLFVNFDEGFIAGENGHVYKTENGGNDWEDVSLPVQEDILSIAAPSDEYLIYVTTASGSIFKKAWTPLNSSIQHSDLSGTPQFQIFPNPAADHFTISLHNQESEYPTANYPKFEIYSLTGQKISSLTPDMANNSGNSWKIDASGFNDGLYLVVMHTENHIYRQKLVVSGN